MRNPYYYDDEIENSSASKYRFIGMYSKLGYILSALFFFAIFITCVVSGAQTGEPAVIVASVFIGGIGGFFAVLGFLAYIEWLNTAVETANNTSEIARHAQKQTHLLSRLDKKMVMHEKRERRREAKENS